MIFGIRLPILPFSQSYRRAQPNHGGEKGEIFQEIFKPKSEGFMPKKNEEVTVTLSAPGIEPITMTDDEFTAAAKKMAGIGHNTKRVNGIEGAHLLQLISKIESLETQKAEIAEEIRGVFVEAKGHGFDVKTIRKILKLRKADPDEVSEQEMLLDVYLNALGMGPLFDGINEAV